MLPQARLYQWSTGGVWVSPRGCGTVGCWYAALPYLRRAQESCSTKGSDLRPNSAGAAEFMMTFLVFFTAPANGNGWR